MPARELEEARVDCADIRDAYVDVRRHCFATMSFIRLLFCWSRRAFPTMLLHGTSIARRHFTLYAAPTMLMPSSLS